MSFENIYLWQDPLVTGPIFASLLIVLISISYYSLISVVSYTALFVLGRRCIRRLAEGHR